LTVNEFLNQTARSAPGLYQLLSAVYAAGEKEGYEAGFADEALPPGGMIFM
jgi:hypothetical protein